MEEMSWPEIRRAIEAGFTTRCLCRGSTEQHGPHAATMTDARIGDDVARRVTRKLRQCAARRGPCCSVEPTAKDSGS